MLPRGHVPLMVQVKLISKRLREHKGAGHLMAELSNIFDEDTERFVLMLYRTVIYETEKAALGLVPAQE